MKAKSLFSVLILAVVAVFFVSGLALSQEKIRLDEYKRQLAEWQKREADAKAQIDNLQKEIAALKEEIAKIEKEIEEVWNAIYADLGVTKAEVDEFRNSLKALDSQLDGLSALSPEELYEKRDEISQIESKLNEAKKNKISLLTEMQDLIAQIEGKLLQIKGRMPAAVYDTYTVVRGDYLWKISKKPEIYNDPYQWMKIYTYNRDQIKNPDLIYPDQIFKILRKAGPNEFIVQKGDFLRKIAGYAEVFNDPTKWTLIYEANKQVIPDPNLIYPYQVLIIPKE